MTHRTRYSLLLGSMLTLVSMDAWAQETAPTPATAPAPVAAPEAPAPASTIEIGPQEEKILRSFKPSYGTVGTSILYSKDNIVALKALLDDVERILALGGSPRPLDLAARPAGQEVGAEAGKIELPTLEFPVFHVASVVYRNNSDWMLWINGQRVTPKRKLPDLQIISVRPDQVQVGWKADNWEFRKDVWRDNIGASTQLQKLKSRQGSVAQSDENQMLVATMRPNQTLVTVGPVLVEGNHPSFATSVSPQMQQSTAEVAAEEGEASESGKAATAERPSLFSGKMAQDYIDRVAKQSSDEISQNSAKELAKKLQPKPQAAEKPPAQPAQDEATQPAAPAPVAPVPQQNVPAPQTLDDILNAVAAPSQPTP